MQEEIKEIIRLNCEEEIEVKYFAKDDSLVDTTMDYSQLLDYITNLQEDNKQLKELCNKYEEEHNNAFKLWTMKMEEMPDYEERMNYKSRCEKAVEYIKKHLEREYFDYDILEANTIYNRDLYKVLNILQGVDKE